MSSILTNNSAMVALQTLKSINMDLGKTQSAISTGKDIASAKDNAAVWSISKKMETDVASYEALESGLKVNGAVVNAAMAGTEAVADKLRDMISTVQGATSESITTNVADVNNKLDEDFAQIQDFISSAQVNGVNLLNDTVDGTQASLTVTMSLDRIGTAAATQNNMTVNAAGLETSVAGATRTALTATNSSTVVGELEAMLTATLTAASNFGSSASRIESQTAFVSKLQDSLEVGISALVDADMEETSAKLSALQTQQQLGVQALSIANQAPQSILSLFR